MRVATAIPTWQPVAVADTTAMTTLGFHNVQGGVSTQRAEIREIYLGGLASASAPMIMLFGRCTTVTGATAVSVRSAPLDPATVLPATPPICTNSTSGTFPQRSSTAGALLNLSFNAFGGIVRWYAGPDEIISLFGTTQPLGELSLNAFTGSTASTSLGSNIVFDLV